MAQGNAIIKPTVWAAKILTDLPKFTVLEKDCTSEFAGEIKRGGRVKILGAGRPTIKDYDGTPIDAPENVETSAIYMDIDHQKYVNYGMDDVDKVQSVKNYLQTIRTQMTEAFAEQYDSDIAKEAVNSGNSVSTTSISSADDLAAAIDTGIIWLRNNGVKTTERTVLELSPYYYDMFTNKIIDLKTQNDALIKNGDLGYYKGVYVKMSNNLYKKSVSGTNCVHLMLRTTRAIAAGKQIEKVEQFRPEDLFYDAVKALLVYGIKVVRPKELYTIRVADH